MTKSLMELSAEIIAAQAQHQTMTPEVLAEGLKAVYQTLQELHQTDQAALSSDPDGQNGLAYLRQHPLESIQRHQVICLESGKAYKLLSNRHLALYGLTPREYKKKWGIPQTMPLSSRALTQRRRKLAKEMGMGSQLAEWRAKRKAEKAG
ncbi:MAG: MucR family transcriptional regulator [Candidatus Tectomicrobia bacterium]|nr:MucR family transcriptional regulator [Candidatus Tectomicrobia bacterium]